MPYPSELKATCRLISGVEVLEGRCLLYAVAEQVLTDASDWMPTECNVSQAGNEPLQFTALYPVLDNSFRPFKAHHYEGTEAISEHKKLESYDLHASFNSILSTIRSLPAVSQAAEFTSSIFDSANFSNGNYVNIKNILRHELRLEHGTGNIPVVDFAGNLVDIAGQITGLSINTHKYDTAHKTLTDPTADLPTKLYASKALDQANLGILRNSGYLLEDLFSLGGQIMKIAMAPYTTDASYYNPTTWASYFELNTLLPENFSKYLSAFNPTYTQWVSFPSLGILLGAFGQNAYQEMQNALEVSQLKESALEESDRLSKINQVLAATFFNLANQQDVTGAYWTIINPLAKFIGIAATGIATLVSWNILPGSIYNTPLSQPSLKVFSGCLIVGSANFLAQKTYTYANPMDPVVTHEIVSTFLEQLKTEYHLTQKPVIEFLQNYNPQVFRDKVIEILGQHPDHEKSKQYLKEALHL